jgi:hypothetical protein
VVPAKADVQTRFNSFLTELTELIQVIKTVIDQQRAAATQVMSRFPNSSNQQKVIDKLAGKSKDEVDGCGEKIRGSALAVSETIKVLKPE